MRRITRNLLLLTLPLALPAAADATTVTREYGGKVDGEKVDIVTVKAARGERNDVTVGVRLKGGFTVTTVREDGARLRVGKGCSRVNATTTRCRGRNDLGMVDVKLRDRADAATVGSRPRSHLLYYVTQIDGGPGDDNLDVDDGGDQILGGDGNDLLRGSSGYESMSGGRGDDVLWGREYGDFLEGGPGDDVLHGGRGNDTLLGGTLDRATRPVGSDRLFGEKGDDDLDDSDTDSRDPVIGRDRLDGGAGEDTVTSYLERTDGVIIDLERSNGAGEPGENDSLRGFETAFGGPGDDALSGDSGPNWLDGRDGNDEVSGRGGNDRIYAWDADAVAGNGGDDDIRTVPEFTGTLSCGDGTDVVRLDVYLEKPADLPGPIIEAPCERLTNGSNFSIDPVPAVDADGNLTFEIIKNRVSGRRLVLSEAAAPFAELASAPIDSTSVTLPPTAEAVVRALVTPLGNAPFAWRFEPR
jgi:Ca2+-binding RTX toxin-like protein